MPPGAAIELIRGDAGKHFDPALPDLLLVHFDEVLAIRAEYWDAGSTSRDGDPECACESWTPLVELTSYA